MGYEWFKTHSNGILRGSLANTDWYVQLLWIKLLAIENETHLRDGCLHFKPGNPMSREYLASQCMLDMDRFNTAIDMFLKDIDPEGTARVTILDDGTIRLNKWSYYQADNKKANDKTKGTLSVATQKKIARVYANKFPDTVIDVIMRDMGYVVINKSTGEILENVDNGYPKNV